MKKIIRTFVLLTSALILLFIAGCSTDFNSVTVDTVMTADKSFDGSRVMSADIPAVIYRKAFGGKLENIRALAKKYAPGQIYCKTSENNLGGAHIEMSIDFGSVKDYQEKLTAICSGNKSEDAVKPSVTFSYSRSLIKKGYTIRENFTSLDLLYWLEDAVKEEYPAAAKKADGILRSGSTSLVLAGAKIDLGGEDKIQASDLESHAFKGIHIESAMESDGSIDTAIRYTAGSKTVKDLGDKLDKLMKDKVPSGGSIAHSDTDSGERIYRMKFTSTGPETFVQAMNRALGSNDTVFRLQSEGNNDSHAVTDTYELYFDGSYFLDFTDKDTDFTFVLNVPSDHSVQSCKGEYGWLKSYEPSYSSSKSSVSMTFSSPDIVKLVLGYTVDIESIDVSTYFHNDISIDRQISFKLTSDADKLIGDGIYAGLKKAAEKYKGQISVDAKKTSGSAEYLVKMNAASASQLTDMTRLVLQEKDQTQTGEGSGQPDCSLMTGGAQQPHQPFKKYIRLTDTINFSSFLKGSKVSGGIQYSLKYPRYFKASFTGNTSFENASSDGQNVSCTSYNSIISVGSNAVKWNIEGIAVLIAWLASLTACLVFVFFEFPHILVYIREKRLDVDGAALFSGKNKKRLAFAALCSACFIIMSIRLIFMIY